MIVELESSDLARFVFLAKCESPFWRDVIEDPTLRQGFRTRTFFQAVCENPSNSLRFLLTKSIENPTPKTHEKSIEFLQKNMKNHH